MSVPRETDDVAGALFGPNLATAKAYAEALGTTGVERGLIGPREVPRLWDRHLLNCVVLKELIGDGVELADVGSGAGLPGLPLAIARPDLSVFLIEPLLRRVVWLREVVLELGLENVEIVRGRGSAVAESGHAFDVVTARAVLPLPGLLQLCLPLLRSGGELLAIKGDGAEAELGSAKSQLEHFGAADWSVVLCGEASLSKPTTVVRVVAGQRQRQGAMKSEAAKTAKPKFKAKTPQAGWTRDAPRQQSSELGPPSQSEGKRRPV